MVGDRPPRHSGRNGYGLRHVNATGFFGETIASHGIGTRARTATHFPKFAHAALTFQVRRVTEPDEERRVSIDFLKRLLADVSGRERQEAAGKSVPLV